MIFSTIQRAKNANEDSAESTTCLRQWSDRGISRREKCMRQYASVRGSTNGAIGMSMPSRVIQLVPLVEQLNGTNIADHSLPVLPTT